MNHDDKIDRVLDWAMAFFWVGLCVCTVAAMVKGILEI